MGRSGATRRLVLVADGALPVRNQTGRTLAVSVRVLPSIRDLDHVLRVRMTPGGRPIYVGPLGGLRTWSRPFVCGPACGAGCPRAVVDQGLLTVNYSLD